MVKNTLAIALVGGMLAGAPASAQNYYVTLSGGGAFLNDSQNIGAFVGDFTTGAGTAIPAGTVLPDGTAVGWDTQFDTGYALSGAVGRGFGLFRGELEVAYQNNGVDTHTGVAAGGIPLAAEDAGVLITGSSNLGVTVGDLVSAGQGDVSTVFVMANAIADLNIGGPITPYIGGGIGVGFVDVTYAPSATTIIDDNSTQFAWQIMAGLAYDIAPKTELFAGYRYRATTDASVSASLFSADFDVENAASIVEAGLRFSF